MNRWGWPLRIGGLALAGALLLAAGAVGLGRLLPRQQAAIAFAPNLIAPTGEIDLFDLTHRLRVRLTAPLEIASMPTWAPEGDRLAYVASLREFSQIVIVDIRRGVRQTMNFLIYPDTRLLVSTPSFSPDGRSLAYSAPREGRAMLEVRDLANDELGSLSITRSFSNASSPTWSPDGRMIAFSWAPADNQDLFLARLDDPALPAGSGDDLLRLTFDAGLDTSPAWSPDGRWIAFVSDRAGSSDIYLIDTGCIAAGTPCDADPMQVTWHSARELSPSWSPDGAALVFISDRGGQFRAWRLPAACAGEADCPAEPLSVGPYDVFYAVLRPG